jgi:arylsulfatase A-like enzyme
VGALGCALVCCASLAACGGRPAPTSVLLITIDTLRADHLGCYGYFRDTSPSIDRLAAEGLLFERAVAPMSITLPSHTSIMTATYPPSHGVWSNLNYFKTPIKTSDSFRLAAQIFQEAGYRTAGFASASPVSAATGLSGGFDVFEAPPQSDRRVEYDARHTVDRARRWLKKAEPPFFLWVHLFDPHRPYSPPPGFVQTFRTTPAVHEHLEQIQVPKRRRDEAADVFSRYDGEISYTDYQLGRLFRLLRDRGLWDETVVVFTADHGEGLYQHDMLTHGELWLEQLLVPLIFKIPGGPAGRRSDLASLIDVLPTITAAVGLDVPPEQLDGIDLVSERRSSALAARQTREERRTSYALITERWKYVFFPESDGPERLFDLVHDPYEIENVVARHPDVAAALRREAEDVVARAEARAPLEHQLEIPEEAREKLRMLGYVE